MGLIEAVKAQSKEGITGVISKALEKYNAKLPEEPEVETAYGAVKVSMLLDDDSKWEIVTAETMAIAREADHIPESMDKEVEIARMIATSGILRNIFTEATGGEGLL